MGLGADIGAGMGATEELGMGLIGQALSDGEREKANQIYQEMKKNVSDVDLPAFEKMVSQQVEKSAQDPRARDAQLAALQKMQTLGDEGGLDAQAQQQNQLARQSQEQAAMGNQQATMANRQQRGMLGSGDELAASLQGNQSAANRGNQAGLDIASQARARALQAMMSSGQMGAQIRSGDQAADNADLERQKFNANMRYAAQGQNNSNAQTAFGNQMGKTKALNGADQDIADRYDQSAARIQKAASGVGRGMNKMSTTAGQGADDYMSEFGSMMGG